MSRFSRLAGFVLALHFSFLCC